MKQTGGPSLLSWALFSVLCLIWGSSFILMKLGMFNTQGASLLSAYQVAALRMLSAAVVLIPFVPGAIRRLQSRTTGWYILLSGLLGSFFPAFLFCIAETRVDSALAGTINAMTPLFTLLIATIFYGASIPMYKWLGIVVGFGGCLLLFAGGSSGRAGSFGYGMLAVLATVCYGLNVNMVRQRLLQVPSLDIATLAFAFLIIPSAAVLYASGFFHLPFSDPSILKATAAASTLGVLGTALASILFYVLVKRAGIVFASLVTYGIPFVAMGWGLTYGEEVTLLQMIALLVILAGVYLANQNFLQLLRWPEKKHPAEP